MSLMRQFMNVRKSAAVFPLVLASTLSACGGPAVEIPSQKWEDVNVRIETRPSIPKAGMNEFLVIATTDKGRPAYDMMVSIRTSDKDAWKQSIQDGMVGVYRRAAEVTPGEREVLQVQLRRKDEEGVLYFPLNLSQ